MTFKELCQIIQVQLCIGGKMVNAINKWIKHDGRRLNSKHIKLVIRNAAWLLLVLLFKGLCPWQLQLEVALSLVLPLWLHSHDWHLVTRSSSLQRSTLCWPFIIELILSLIHGWSAIIHAKPYVEQLIDLQYLKVSMGNWGRQQLNSNKTAQCD